MGGYGSGRSGGRPTTESGLTLNLSKLFRDGLFRPGSFRSGSLIWTNTTTGEQVGSLGYEAQLGEGSGRVRLKYTTTRWDGERRESDYWIQLETTPQPFVSMRPLQTMNLGLTGLQAQKGGRRVPANGARRGP